MEADNQPVEKTANKQPDKDANGKFAKGNKIGNRFSKDNQPDNHPGRPKSKKLTDALLKHLDAKASTFSFTDRAARKMKMDPDTVTCYEVLMATSILHSVKGKGDILKEIWSRIEGAIPKTLNLGPTDEFGAYLDAMREQTQFEPADDPDESEDSPEDMPDADAS